jgi:hypothetical protein
MSIAARYAAEDAFLLREVAAEDYRRMNQRMKCAQYAE